MIEGGFLILVACSKPYAISISFGSEPFSPPKDMPKGTPLLSYPAGTLIAGNPQIAKTGAATALGVTNASNMLSLIIFSNPSLDSFAKLSNAAFSLLPIPFVAWAARNISWPNSLIISCKWPFKSSSYKKKKKKKKKK
jgi:hypothetical protein